MEIAKEHLAMVQGVINRLNSNSFTIKGWTVTLCAAIFALSGAVENSELMLSAIVPIIAFWILDSHYLANERCFVSLYGCITKARTVEIDKEKLIREKRRQLENEKNNKLKITVAEWSMNFIEFRSIRRNNWYSAMFSDTFLWFYPLLIVASIVLFFLYQDETGGLVNPSCRPCLSN